MLNHIVVQHNYLTYSLAQSKDPSASIGMTTALGIAANKTHHARHLERRATKPRDLLSLHLLVDQTQFKDPTPEVSGQATRSG